MVLKMKYLIIKEIIITLSNCLIKADFRCLEGNSHGDAVWSNYDFTGLSQVIATRLKI